jgi:hypothetical protein
VPTSAQHNADYEAAWPSLLQLDLRVIRRGLHLAMAADRPPDTIKPNRFAYPITDATSRSASLPWLRGRVSRRGAARNSLANTRSMMEMASKIRVGVGNMRTSE